MASPKKKSIAKNAPAAATLEAQKSEDIKKAMAWHAMRPSVSAAVTFKQYAGFGDLDLLALADELSSQITAIHEGDLKRGEAMLTVQAHTLDAIFNNLARRAANAEYLSQHEAYLRLALKAQMQCRFTWEALSAMKNPTSQYVRQQNVAVNQQVNNEARAPAGEKGKAQIELLEENSPKRLATETTHAVVGEDPAMATVGTINRTQDCGR